MTYVLLTSLVASGQERLFRVDQIADSSRRNVAPSIGGNGLVLWESSSTNTFERSDIVKFDGADIVNLTEAETYLAGGFKPQVEGDMAVWMAPCKPLGGPDNWILSEVPDRDEGYQEIPATYRAWTDPDETPRLAALDTLTNLVTDVTSTNALESGFETNAIPPGSLSTNKARRYPLGPDEIILWKRDGGMNRISRNKRNDYGPSVWDGLISWQVAKGFPFGWEIMVWETNHFVQLTTNFYYDMAPKVQGREITWYGWDGHDFEVFLYNKDREETVQITSNQYDDLSPVIWEGQIAWEGYPTAEADVYLYKDGQSQKLSDNIEDDFAPRIWKGKVVWQSFDGDDFEIYYYDGEKQPIKLTSNIFDDVNPEIRDGLICWMGYSDNWDAEIFAYDLDGKVIWLDGIAAEEKTDENKGRLTFNEEEDRDPKTAGGKIVWQKEVDAKYEILLASPK